MIVDVFADDNFSGVDESSDTIDGERAYRTAKPGIGTVKGDLPTRARLRV